MKTGEEEKADRLVHDDSWCRRERRREGRSKAVEKKIGSDEKIRFSDGCRFSSV